MKQLSSQLQRVFFKKSGLSQEIYHDIFGTSKDDFLSLKGICCYDMLISVAERDGKFGILLIDESDEFYSNGACINELKAFWGQDFKRYVDQYLPSMVEDIEERSIFNMGLLIEEDGDYDDDDVYDYDDYQLMINGILNDVLSRIKQKANPVVTNQNISMVLEKGLTALLIVALCKSLSDEENNDQEERLMALTETLISCLGEIRMSAETGREDCREELDACLDVIKKAVENTRSEEFSAFILRILCEAKIKAPDDITEIMMEVFSEADINQEEANSDFTAIVKQHDCPFQLKDAVFSPVIQISEEAKTNIINLLLQQEDQIAKDAACLSILDENPNIRSYILQHLLNHYKSVVSGESLRRFVAIRNWLSGKDQNDLDRIIVKCKKANIVIPRLDSHKIIDLFGSIVDGSGGQGIWGLAEKDGKFVNFGIFFKLGFGFRDFWFNSDLGEKEAKDFRTLLVASPEFGQQKISLDCMHSFVRYFLYYHTKHLGCPPQALLLKVTEILGSPILAPDDGLIELKPSEKLNLDKKDVIPESWLYSPESTKNAALNKGSKTAKIKKICTHLSEKEKLMWIENFRIASILSFHCPEIELPSPQTLVNSMNALEKAVPASEVPIMKKIAEWTVEVDSR